MRGAIRFSFDRAPDYLGALCVEGHYSEVLVCREDQTQRVIGTGHRSVKPAFVNGKAVPVGYLGGLRVEERARSARLLAAGYRALRALHANRPLNLYLTTIMEGNPDAREVLVSHRFGLPVYHDFGRFCCMALGLSGKDARRSNSGILVRKATAADGPTVVDFLNRHGGSRQFYPEYRLEDFGGSSGLLRGLGWQDVFLGLRNGELVGVLAAWDQRSFRRWQVENYALWMRWLRIPLNLFASSRGMPRLPRPGSPLSYFILSLACIRDDDRAVFRTLLEAILFEKRPQYSFFLAGFHERDPLLPELMARPHVPLPSRLYVVAWEEGSTAITELETGRVPYLELGAL
jgi:hypothetical protein